MSLVPSMPHTTPPEPLRSFSGLARELGRELEEADRGRAELVRRAESGRILPNTLDALRLELTYHSNAIEGNTLSLRETQMVLEGLTPPGERPMREVYEARNHARAIGRIERWAGERSTSAPITERDLLDLHADVLADIDPRWAGRLRADRVLIAGTRFVPPGAQKFGDLIPDLLALANEPSTHPLLRGAELHYNVAAVHPFTDGNGRTARLISNYLLLRTGFPLAIVEVGERGAYLQSLDDANTGKCESFARLIIRAVARSITRLSGPD